MPSRSDGGRDMAQAQLEREPGEPRRRVLPLRRLGEGLAPSRLAPAPFEDAEASRLSPLDRDDWRRAPRFTSVAEGRRWNTGRGGPEGAAGTRQRRHFGLISSVAAGAFRRTPCSRRPSCRRRIGRAVLVAEEPTSDTARGRRGQAREPLAPAPLWACPLGRLLLFEVRLGVDGRV